MQEIPENVYNTVKGSLDNYTNDITAYQAFTDEILQNFFDSAKDYIRECKNKNIIPQKSEMRIIIEKSKASIIIKQTGTTGIIHRDKYLTYSDTSKNSNSNSAGSRGIGWKIWQLICNKIETETQIDGNYYQMVHNP